MIIKKSNFLIYSLFDRYQLKIILFSVILSSLFYIYNVSAIDEINEKKLFLINSSKIQNNITDNNTLSTDFNFSNVTNLTNNALDSVYAQIAAVNNSVYIVWQESINDSSNNYDILFIKSEDNGNTFSKPINLSNNTGFSEHPQIVVFKNDIFIVWADNTNSNNTYIMFTKSENNGTTFSKPINLSNNTKNSNNVEISAFDDNVYIVWHEINDENNNKNSSIMFKSSVDSGNTFDDTVKLATTTNDSYPKINSYHDYVYIVWNSENNENFSKDNDNGGLFFIKSSDKGNTFGNSVRIDNHNFGEAQISVSKDEVLIGWGGLHSKNINNVYFVKSYDNGTSFTDPYTIQVNKSKNKNYFEKINHPTNIEIATNEPSYIVWQNVISKENHDILIADIKSDFQSTKIVNLSNNTGISECPQIAVGDNHIYVVWEDITPGNHEILFTKGMIQ